MQKSKQIIEMMGFLDNEFLQAYDRKFDGITSQLVVDYGYKELLLTEIEHENA